MPVSSTSCFSWGRASRRRSSQGSGPSSAFAVGESPFRQLVTRVFSLNLHWLLSSFQFQQSKKLYFLPLNLCTYHQPQIKTDVIFFQSCERMHCSQSNQYFSCPSCPLFVSLLLLFPFNPFIISFLVSLFSSFLSLLLLYYVPDFFLQCPLHDPEEE